jgi:hypothetical protein
MEQWSKGTMRRSMQHDAPPPEDNEQAQMSILKNNASVAV